MPLPEQVFTGSLPFLTNHTAQKVGKFRGRRIRFVVFICRLLPCIDLDHRMRPPQEIRHGAIGQTHQSRDHLGRDRHGDVPDHLHPSRGHRLVKRLVDELFDSRSQALDLATDERLVDQGSHQGMAWRFEVQQRVLFNAIKSVEVRGARGPTQRVSAHDMFDLTTESLITQQGADIRIPRETPQPVLDPIEEADSAHAGERELDSTEAARVRPGAVSVAGQPTPLGLAQSQYKGGTLAFDRFGVYRPTQQVDRLFDDIEADSGTLDIVFANQAHIGIEYVRRCVAVKAPPVVGNGNH